MATLFLIRHAVTAQTGRVLYGQVYEAMRQQTDAFAIKPVEPQAAQAEERKLAGPFQPKSAWAGKGDHARSVLTVTERTGDTFQARWVTAKGGEKVVTGKIDGDKISWLAKDARSVTGGPAVHDFYGTITGGQDGDKIDFVWRGGKGKSGTFSLYRTKAK